VEVPREYSVKGLRWVVLIALACSVQAGAVTLTLSQRGIEALDYMWPPASASIVQAVPSGKGVEYTILFRARTARLLLSSANDCGKGLLAGLPLNQGDRVGLRFTLVSTSPASRASVFTGTSVNGRWQPVLLGGDHDTTGTSVPSADGGEISELGFMIRPVAESWPEAGGVLRLLVEPLPMAIPIEPREEPEPFVPGPPGQTLTLTQRDLLALPKLEGETASASILRAIPSGNGVEYTIRFDNNAGILRMGAGPLGGESSLLSVPLSGADSFALRFTLLALAPDPQATVSVAASINKGSALQTVDSPLRLGGKGRQVGISDTGTNALMTRKLGFVVYIAPAHAKSWPTTGGTVRILVEPAPNATPISAIGRSGAR
jgi:hypothetical protein